MGDAPIARIALAQSFTVTKFVMQCVKGHFSLTFFIKSGIFSSIFYSLFVIIINYKFNFI